MNKSEKAALSKDIKKRENLLLESIVFAVVTGVIVGFFGTLLEEAVNLATEFRTENDWIIFLMPLAGLIIVGLYHLAGVPNPLGTNKVIWSVRRGDPIGLRMAPLIFMGTVLTHLTGGSSGREGAALQLGGSIANTMARHLPRMRLERNIMTMCGMSAGFSALFGTPLAAAVFAIEVAEGELYYAAFFPCVLSAATARTVNSMMGGHPVAFNLPSDISLQPIVILQVIIFGLSVGLLSIAFCEVLHKTAELEAKWIKNQFLRVAAAGAFVAVFTTLIGTRDYNGAGMDVIARAIGGEAVPYAFILKLLLTAITLGAGFKGGEIVPTFYVGATFGCVLAPLLGMDPCLGAAMGLICNFCAVTNCPLASIFLAFELFSGKALILFALACGIAYVVSGNFSLYKAQYIIHDKQITRKQ